jgi:drug/metabolite transporter (DMT)-like permease
MKKMILFCGFLFFCLNFAYGKILGFLPLFNTGLSCGVIAVSTLLLFVLNFIKTATGFKISKVFIFLFLGILSLVLSYFSPTEWEKNLFVLLILVITAVEVVILSVSYIVSRQMEAENE